MSGKATIQPCGSRGVVGECHGDLLLNNVTNEVDLTEGLDWLYGPH